MAIFDANLAPPPLGAFSSGGSQSGAIQGANLAPPPLGAFSSFALFTVDANANIASIGTAGGAAAAVLFRMRGNDGTLGYPVYWNSETVDSAGTDYAGPGPLSDVVLSEKIAPV